MFQKTALLFLLQLPILALSLPENDVENIRNMTGCYEVSFEFAETFPRTKGYVLQKPYSSKGLEWIVEIESPNTNEIRLQHILIVGPERALKHWRQSWTYEPRQIWHFLGDRKWTKDILSLEEVKNQWSQTVTQVDDSPRYSCLNSWSHSNKPSFWECQSWNPLPRREFSKRSDYNVLVRRNRHEITPYGWIHEQDNEKAIVSNETINSILVEEKGKNIYQKVDSVKCQVASRWWNKNKDAWSTINDVWDEISTTEHILHFKKKETPLWDDLFTLAQKAQLGQWTTKVIKQKAKGLIESHLYTNK